MSRASSIYCPVEQVQSIRSRAASILSTQSGISRAESALSERRVKEQEIEDEPEPLEPWNFTWIVKRELAIMGYPKCRANIRYLSQANIGHLVSLSPEKQPPFEMFPNDMRWTPLDVLEFDPPTLKQIDAFINLSRDTLVTGKAVGVHCRMGKGRSGVMAACYMVYFYGLTPENAVTHVRMASPGCIETYQQEKIIKAYHDELRSRSPPPGPRPPTEEEKIQELYDKYNPEAFIPDSTFRPRPLQHPTFDRYYGHVLACPGARQAKRTYLPHRTEERHAHTCKKMAIPPKSEKMMYIVHDE